MVTKYDEGEKKGATKAVRRIRSTGTQSSQKNKEYRNTIKSKE